MAFKKPITAKARRIANKAKSASTDAFLDQYGKGAAAAIAKTRRKKSYNNVEERIKRGTMGETTNTKPNLRSTEEKSRRELKTGSNILPVKVPYRSKKHAEQMRAAGKDTTPKDAMPAGIPKFKLGQVPKDQQKEGFQFTTPSGNTYEYKMTGGRLQPVLTTSGAAPVMAGVPKTEQAGVQEGEMTPAAQMAVDIMGKDSIPGGRVELGEATQAGVAGTQVAETTAGTTEGVPAEGTPAEGQVTAPEGRVDNGALVEQMEGFDPFAAKAQVEASFEDEFAREEQELIEKLGISAMGAAANVKAQEAVVEATKQQARKDAMSLYFGGSGGQPVSTLDIGALQSFIDNAARQDMGQLMQLKQDLANFDEKAISLLSDLRSDQKKEVLDMLDRYEDSFNKNIDRSFDIYKQQRKEYEADRAFEYKNYYDDRTASRLEQAQNLQIEKENRIMNESLREFLSGDEIASLSERFGANAVGGIIADHFSQIGVQVTPEFLQAIDEVGVKEAFMNDAKMLSSLAKMTPEQQMVILNDLPDMQLRAKGQALAEATIESNIRERTESLEDFAEKERIKSLYKKKVSSGGGRGLVPSGGGTVQTTMDRALANNVPPERFAKEFLGGVAFDKDDKAILMEDYNKSWEDKKKRSDSNDVNEMLNNEKLYYQYKEESSLPETEKMQREMDAITRAAGEIPDDEYEDVEIEEDDSFLGSFFD